MSEAGLRAWIGEVERKLGKRTRVMLALAAIAIGAAGAAVFIAIEADNQAVSKGDVQALQRQLEARIAQGAGGSAAVTRLETELRSLKAEVEALKGGTGKKGASGASGAPGTSGSTTKLPGAGASGSAPGGTGTTGPTIGGLLKKLQQQSSGSAKK